MRRAFSGRPTVAAAAAHSSNLATSSLDDSLLFLIFAAQSTVNRPSTKGTNGEEVASKRLGFLPVCKFRNKEQSGQAEQLLKNRLLKMHIPILPISQKE